MVTGEAAVPSDWIDPDTSISAPLLPEDTPSMSTSVPGLSVSTAPREILKSPPVIW